MSIGIAMEQKHLSFTKALMYWNGVFSLGDDVAVPV
jgi:hypothetical protein